MKRRDFLMGSMGALATGVTGCAGISQVIAPDSPNVTPLQMDRFLTRLDSAMNQITEDHEGGRYISELHEKPMNEKGVRMFRQGMRSLLLAGNFGDLSVAGQVHPGIQKRLHYSAPEMNAAISETTDQIKTMSPTARVEMQAVLRDDPTLGDRVLKKIELEAAAVGASNRRLMQLHVMGKHIIGRMKHSSDMFINEYVTKYEKLTAVPGSAAESYRFMAARMGQAAFKARVQEAENAAQYWGKQEIEDIPIGYQLVGQEGRNRNVESGIPGMEQTQSQPVPNIEEIIKNARSDPRQDWYRTGLRTLGIGAISTVIGLVLISVAVGSGGEAAAVPGGVGVVLGITVGPAAILAGLVTLMIGAVQ